MIDASAPSAEALQLRLKSFFEANRYDGLFIASLDHSPSEQIDSNNDWYTTVLILSVAVEHANFARAIEERLPEPRRLRKWKNMKGRARAAFAKAAFELLPDFPVLIFAITAHRSAIERSEQQFIEELGISKCVRRKLEGDRTYRIFGPLQRVKPTGEHEAVELKERLQRSQMALFIARFVRRMQLAIFGALGGHWAINFQFYADKLPGGERYGDLLNFLFNMGNPAGRLLLGHFNDSDTVETDLLADNFAGLLREAALNPELLGNIAASNEPGGIFYWERSQS